jgi:hypothetical protein
MGPVRLSWQLEVRSKEILNPAHRARLKSDGSVLEAFI